MMHDDTSIRRAVRDHYSRLAQAGNREGWRGFILEEADSKPAEANRTYDGCGSPIEAAAVKEGEIVVDLGSGSGYDVFRASRLVGQSGRVIGVDATPEIILRARETAKNLAFSNIAFREAYRIMRPGGRLVVSDTVAECTLKFDSDSRDAWTECAAGALPEDDYLNLITKAGFVDVEIEAKTQSCCSRGIANVTVIAKKPN